MAESAHSYSTFFNVVLHNAPIENSFKSLFYFDVDLEFWRQFSGAESSPT